MANSKKTIESVDYSMQDKIIALYELQKIDTKIDEINKVKGVLPSEVAGLEGEVAGLKTKIDGIKASIEEIGLQTRAAKEEIEQDKLLIEKYSEQQKNVRNNREFDAISKEIEYQDLQIQLSEKHLKEYSAEQKSRKKLLEETEAMLEERKIDLDMKRAELESIDKETVKEIEDLHNEEKKAMEKIDDRLLAAYKRIRSNVHNGLGVVTVKRDACGGCYNRIPPQRQYEIRQNKKVIVCEYCGRILVSDELVAE